MSPRPFASTSIGHAVLELMTDGKCRFVREIVAELGISNYSAKEAGRRLAARGLLERTVPDGVSVVRITEAGQAFLATKQPLIGHGKGTSASRHRTSLRARAWNVMRMRVWWTVGDLFMTIADGTEGDAEANLLRYVRALFKAGYLTESRREKGRWHLKNDTGRLAPALNTQTGTLTDTNTGEVHDV